MSGRYRAAPSYDGYDDSRSAYRRVRTEYPARRVRAREQPTQVKRSHAAIPVAVILLLFGIVLGHITILIPGLLGLFMVYTSLSFLSSRLNPFSIGFYLTVKPSWTAIAVLFLLGLLLLYVAYSYYLTGYASVLPDLARLR